MHTGIEQRTIAHTAALQVIVGERPIRSRHHAAALIEQLRRQRQRQRYRDEGVYENDAQLAYMTRLFDLAIERLSEQTRDPP
jgi:hypothetical protein